MKWCLIDQNLLYSHVFCESLEDLLNNRDFFVWLSIETLTYHLHTYFKYLDYLFLLLHSCISFRLWMSIIFELFEEQHIFWLSTNPPYDCWSIRFFWILGRSFVNPRFDLMSLFKRKVPHGAYLLVLLVVRKCWYTSYYRFLFFFCSQLQL